LASVITNPGGATPAASRNSLIVRSARRQSLRSRIPVSGGSAHVP